MNGNRQGVGQELVVVVIVVVLEVGQLSLQSPQYPCIWFVLVSVAVLHQGLEKPPAVVQEEKVIPWKVKGKTQAAWTMAPLTV